MPCTILYTHGKGMSSCKLFFLDSFPHLLLPPQYPKLRSTIWLVGFTSSLVHFSSTFFSSTLPFSSGLTSSTTPPSPESSGELSLFLLSRQTSRRIIITAMMAANTKPKVAGNP